VSEHLDERQILQAALQRRSAEVERLQAELARVQDEAAADRQATLATARALADEQHRACPTRAHWLADLMVEWSRSEYPRLFPPEWRHASLVGWLMNAALLTPEQTKEVHDALGAPR